VWNEAFSQLFQQVHQELRAKDREWHEVRKKTGLKLDNHVHHTVVLDVDHPSRGGCAPTIPSGGAVDADFAECSNFKSILRMKRDIKGKGEIYFGQDQGW